MFKEVLLFFLLGHVLGDFYTQTDNMAEKKKIEFRWVIYHLPEHYLFCDHGSIKYSLYGMGLIVIGYLCVYGTFYCG